MLAGAALGSCARRRAARLERRAKGRTVLVPTASRVDAVPGMALVVPVRVEGMLPGSIKPRIALSDGREIEGALVWIGVEAAEAGPSGWIPTMGRWVVAPAAEGAIPASTGSWHVVADIPTDAGGQAVRFGDRSVRVNWLADPRTLRPGGLGGGEVWEPWRRPPEAPMPSADLLAPEWRNPLWRWRARLVTSGLDAPPAAGDAPPAADERGALGALADLVEARWRVGLARLWYADAGASARLLGRLTRAVELSPGVVAPAWPIDQPALDSLLTDLLDPSLSGGALASRADAWLGSQPGAAAWIADDAAALDPRSGEPLVAIRAASLAAEAALLWLAGQRGARVGDPMPIGAGEVRRLEAPAGAGLAQAGARRFTVHCGDESLALSAREIEPIRPPGARCGPLLHDWTLDAWSRSDPLAGASPARAWSAVAMLYRDDSGVSESGWSLFLECASDGGQGDDVVRAWFGERGAPGAVLRIAADGAVRNEAGPGEEILLGASREAGRWSVSVPIPSGGVEPGGVIRVGLSRTDARGVRTAWPRRLMPWEEEPARAALDTRAWSGLDRAGG